MVGRRCIEVTGVRPCRLIPTRSLLRCMSLQLALLRHHRASPGCPLPRGEADVVSNRVTSQKTEDPKMDSHLRAPRRCHRSRRHGRARGPDACLAAGNNVMARRAVACPHLPLTAQCEQLPNRVPQISPSFAGGNTIRSRASRGGEGSAPTNKPPFHAAFLVLPVRIELTTSPLPRGCSTTELRQHLAAPN